MYYLKCRGICSLRISEHKPIKIELELPEKCLVLFHVHFSREVYVEKSVSTKARVKMDSDACEYLISQWCAVFNL